jgi:N-acetylneuraminic acid mutarotase
MTADSGAPRSWRALPSLPFPQQETAVALLGDRVFVLGGLDTLGATLVDVQVYDPVAGRWSAGDPLPRPLHHINAAVVEGRLWITGALTGAGFAALGDTWVYDPAAPSWTKKSTMPAGTERGSSMVAAIATRIVVAGGLRAGSAVADVSIYDTTLDTWTSQPSLPSARDHGAGVSVDGIFYAVGGRGAAIGGHTPRVDAFDPIAAVWSERAPLLTSRGGFAAALLEGRIIVLGGEGNAGVPGGVFAEVESYDPRTNSWSSLPPMRTPRHGMGAVAIGRTLIVPGGGTVQGLAATDVVEALE